jgi:hypothetical protein
MIKIPYPNPSTAFDKRYADALIAANKANFKKADAILKDIKYKGSKLNVAILLVAKFEDLLSIHEIIENKLSDDTFAELEKLFNYHGSNQGKIADFFMQQTEIPMQSCFCCNIDYINAFVDIGDYKDALDFLNNAQRFEIEQLHGVGKKSAAIIIAERLKLKEEQKSNDEEIVGFEDINDVPRLKRQAKKQLEDRNFRSTHNHFTLDHFLPQSKYKCLSLCLYNFIPTCYSCNSKFKKDKEFNVTDINDLKYVSPSSKDYSLHTDLTFKIFYTKQLHEIKMDADYHLEKEIKDREVLVQDFLNMYKIEGRYVFHKKTILELIEKKIKYPEAKLKEISEISGIPVDELRETIFGEELFNADLESKPLTKLKRDIAKEIKIDKVL